jgi:nucleoside-diphosphate-sugar epimerase
VPTSPRIIATSAPLVILGASGFVGRHVVARALARWPAPVVRVSRRAEPVVDRATTIRGDVRDTDVVARQLPPGATIVNATDASVAGSDENLALSDAVIDLCLRARASRLVHVSTAVVVGPDAPPLIDEQTPCRPATSYQRTKLAIESRIRERLRNHCFVVTLRPTAVFGQGGANLRKLVNDMRGGSALRNYARACLFGRRPMNLVPVETVASAVLFSAAFAADEPLVWIVSEDDAEENNFRHVETAIRRASGVGPHPWPIVPLPVTWLTIAQRLAGRRALPTDAKFSAARLRAAGFRAPMAFRDALARYATLAAANAV